MNNNDILRSLRYLLSANDGRMAKIIQLTGLKTTRDEIAHYMQWEGTEGYLPCPDIIMAHFLDGLVIEQRGVDETRPSPPIDPTMSNNKVLKKLRVAFSLKQEDVQALLEAAGFKVSKSELSALFRKEDHPHYRPCGDQFLRNFLKGMTQKLKSSSAS